VKITERQFDTWFPRVQRVVVLAIGTGGIVYSTLASRIEFLGVFGPLLMWQGYQELRRAGNGNGGEK
jgi:hypothetical protein